MLLPYDGGRIEFLAKNMRMPINLVFAVLGKIELPCDDLVIFLINERVKNRKRSTVSYEIQLNRADDTTL